MEDVLADLATNLWIGFLTPAGVGTLGEGGKDGGGFRRQIERV